MSTIYFKVRTAFPQRVYLCASYDSHSEEWLFSRVALAGCRSYWTLIYSMVQSPSWEANWSAASQETPHISPNPKVHYRTHKRLPPVSILGQPNPVHIPKSHLLQIYPNIIHPSTPRSPQWSPSLRFPQQDPIHPPLLTHTRDMPSPFHSSRFYQPHNIGWGVQTPYYISQQKLCIIKQATSGKYCICSQIYEFIKLKCRSARAKSCLCMPIWLTGIGGTAPLILNLGTTCGR